ncbi:MAG: thioredoxin family protein [Verrucomicrobiota bacterium]
MVPAAFSALTWVKDFEEGKRLAAESGKDLLVDFTGSDWCHWCVKLKEEVFEKEGFEKVAERYVLVELDFPQAEELVTPEQRAANEKVAEEYRVQGFPTILLVDSKGRPFGRTGYVEGGPEAYLEHLDELQAPWMALKGAKGEGRVEALATFLRSVPGADVGQYYGEEVDELRMLDPNDETGYMQDYDFAKAVFEYEQAFEAKMRGGDYDGVLTLVDEFVAEHDPQGEDRQHILMARVMVYVERKEKEKAYAELDAIAEVKPGSDFGQNVESIKEDIGNYLKQREQMEKEIEAMEAAEAAEQEPVGGEVEVPESEVSEE